MGMGREGGVAGEEWGAQKGEGVVKNTFLRLVVDQVHMFFSLDLLFTSLTSEINTNSTPPIRLGSKGLLKIHAQVGQRSNAKPSHNISRIFAHGKRV